jgi:hypothetical protein
MNAEAKMTRTASAATAMPIPTLAPTERWAAVEAGVAELVGVTWLWAVGELVVATPVSLTMVDESGAGVLDAAPDVDVNVCVRSHCEQSVPAALASETIWGIGHLPLRQS